MNSVMGAKVYYRQAARIGLVRRKKIVWHVTANILNFKLANMGERIPDDEWLVGLWCALHKKGKKLKATEESIY